MGTYATNTTFETLLNQFFRENEISFDPEGREMIDTAIPRAEATVNAALARRYSLPFTATPPEVKRITEDIASYYLIRASHWQTSGATKNDYLEEFKTAFEDLKAIATGESSLADSTGSLIPVNTSGLFKSSSENYSQIFDVDDPDSWAVDEDRLDDIEDARE